MITEITPFVSCVVTPDAFESALTGSYVDIYVPNGKGYLRHVKLSNDRSIRLQVDSLPKEAKIPQSQILKEEINFLPAGKIPFSLFEQIVELFRKVMQIKKADFEAHAWILWNAEAGYHISVPPQVVSKASVTFNYEALKPGDVIVVDLHSHNTMGAFFSGTDDANDKMSICYSGVIGKLTPADYEYVFRFNLYDTKRKADLEDVFEFPLRPEIEVPESWLDQIQVNTGKGGKTSTTPSILPQNLKERLKSFLPEDSIEKGEMPPSLTMPSLWDTALVEAGLHQHNLLNLPPDIKIDAKSGCVILDSEEAKNKTLREDSSKDSTRGLSKSGEKNGKEDKGKKKNTSLSKDDEITPEDEEMIASLDEFSYNVCQFGKDAAEARQQIDFYLDDLDDCDDLLLDLIRTAYEKLGDPARIELATNGF
jgi:PRTRC genetic system protein A